MKSCIDEPEPGSVVRPWAWIRGWCFDEGGLPVEAIRARIGHRIFAGTARLHRPDVRKAFGGPPSSEWSGFSIPVRVPPGESSVMLEAKTQDKGWLKFEEIRLRSPWTAAASHAARLAGFWPQVVLGLAGALNRLEPWEQEHVIDRIERVRGHSLSADPHYPPRQVILERFPAAKGTPGGLPKVTVVTPSLQQGRYLEATMRSVLLQEGVRLDYVVRDGGSTDGSVGILERYASKLRSWSSEQDGGQADAVRRGFLEAECGPDDLMAYLNSDDLLMPGSVRFVADYFSRHPKVDVVYGHRVLIDEAGLDVGRWFTPRPSCFDLRIHDFVPQETLFWRRRIWDRIGGISADFKFSADWDLLLRFSQAGARFHRLPWFLGMFRRHPEQKTSTQALAIGVRERDALRRRSLGRMPTPEEIGSDMKRAQLESAFLASAFARGWRI